MSRPACSALLLNPRCRADSSGSLGSAEVLSHHQKTQALVHGRTISAGRRRPAAADHHAHQPPELVVSPGVSPVSLGLEDEPLLESCAQPDTVPPPPRGGSDHLSHVVSTPTSSDTRRSGHDSPSPAHRHTGLARAAESRTQFAILTSFSRTTIKRRSTTQPSLHSPPSDHCLSLSTSTPTHPSRN